MNKKASHRSVGTRTTRATCALFASYWIAPVVLLALGGCVTGPDYKRPEIDTPESWRVEVDTAREIANAQWWEQFGDPVLNDLIDSALEENKDLKMAAARVEVFEGLYRTSRSGLFPQLGGSASAGRARATELTPQTSGSTSKYQELMGLTQQAQAVASQLQALTSGTGSAASASSSSSQNSLASLYSYENPADSYRAGLNASWEIDLWGKLRRANESARAELLGAEEGRRGVVLTLVTAVSQNYVNLRTLDRVLEIARATLQTRADSLRLFTLRFEKGLISQLELSQVQSQYEQARAALPSIERAVAQQENMLCMLLGRNPGPIPRGKTLDELALPAVPAGLPSDLLTNRPDIRQAEQDLISANAQIGVARAQYFPSISLTGAFGRASTDIDTLFTGPGKVWSYAAPVSVPIFTAGALSGRVKAAKASQQAALVRYEQSIQNAFREVEDALVAVKSAEDELDAQMRQFDAFSTYAQLARRRYDSGYSSYIEVLDSERGVFSAELGAAQTRGSLFLSLVSLYKAMGNGW